MSMSTRPDDQFDFNEPTRIEPERKRRRRPQSISDFAKRNKLLVVICVCAAAIIGGLVFGAFFRDDPSLQQAYFDAHYNRIPIQEGKTYSGECFVIDRGGQDGAITVLGTWPNSDQQGPVLHWKGSMKDAPLIGRTIRFRCKIVNGAPELLSWR